MHANIKNEGTMMVDKNKLPQEIILPPLSTILARRERDAMAQNKPAPRPGLADAYSYVTAVLERKIKPSRIKKDGTDEALQVVVDAMCETGYGPEATRIVSKTFQNRAREWSSDLAQERKRAFAADAVSVGT